MDQWTNFLLAILCEPLDVTKKVCRAEQLRSSWFAYPDIVRRELEMGTERGA